MFNRGSRYSYREREFQRHRLLRFLFILFVIYVFYSCVTAFFFSVWVIDNNTMLPALSSGDRLIFSSFTPPGFLSKRPGTGGNPAFNRGNIVLIDMGKNKERNWLSRAADGVVRFFTFQRKSVFSSRGQYYVKRVIAVPGDEISMKDYVFRVKSARDSYSLTEFELSEKPYHPAIPKNPDLWDASVPFSGDMDTVVLGPDEYYVVSDDRSNTNDSRGWGAVSKSMITAKAVLRFWPLSKLEIL